MRVTRLAVATLVVMAACHGEDQRESPYAAAPTTKSNPAPPPVPEPPTPVAPMAPSVPDAAIAPDASTDPTDSGAPPIVVTWSNVKTVDNCFYFSGPEGRDDQLTGVATAEKTGDQIRLTIGHAVFEGSLRDDDLAVMRASSHDFNGRWSVVEAIHGKYREGQILGTYSYQECDQHTPKACPGRCTINASIAFHEALAEKP